MTMQERSQSSSQTRMGTFSSSSLQAISHTRSFSQGQVSSLPHAGSSPRSEPKAERESRFRLFLTGVPVFLPHHPLQKQGGDSQPIDLITGIFHCVIGKNFKSGMVLSITWQAEMFPQNVSALN